MSALLPAEPSDRWGTRTCFPGAGRTPRRSPASRRRRRRARCRRRCPRRSSPPWRRRRRRWPWPRSSRSPPPGPRSCPRCAAGSWHGTALQQDKGCVRFTYFKPSLQATATFISNQKYWNRLGSIQNQCLYFVPIIFFYLSSDM